VKLPGSLAVPIVGDAAIGSQTVADGRMLPVLILDTSSFARPIEVDALLGLG
jgi:hypothetical protein